MKVSVVIPTFSKWDILKYTLNRFENVNFNKDDYEVIVCINGDTLPENYFKDVHNTYHLKILNIKEANRAMARNVCIKQATGEIIVFTDDDTIISDDFLKIHYEIHSEQKVVAVGIRKQVVIPEDSEYKKMNLENIEETAYSGIYYKQVIEPILQNGVSKNWICSVTGNMSVEKKELENVGLFDSNFQGWGFEDMELGFRLSREGNRFVLAKGAVNYHIEHKRNRAKMIKEMKENINYFHNKYNENVIKDYWEFYCGRLSLQQFDKKYFKEFKQENNLKENFFLLFRSSGLPAL